MPEDGDLHHQQQKCNTDGNDNDSDTKREEVFEENESNLDIFNNDVQEEALIKETAESQQKKMQHSDHHGNVL